VWENAAARHRGSSDAAHAADRRKGTDLRQRLQLRPSSPRVTEGPLTQRVIAARNAPVRDVAPCPDVRRSGTAVGVGGGKSLGLTTFGEGGWDGGGGVTFGAGERLSRPEPVGAGSFEASLPQAGDKTTRATASQAHAGRRPCVTKRSRKAGMKDLTVQR
jgi:hypothetical protein